MIQHKEIFGLMKGKIPYTKKTLSRLSNLIEKYPFFQTAHILHTLNLLSLQDSHFLIDLNKTAIYAQDRKQLFFLIESEGFIPEQTDAIESESIRTESSFDLIDNFLSDSNSEEKTELETVETDLSPISSEYVSYQLSDDDSTEEAPPLQYQETIDKFLAQDVYSPLKYRRDKTDKQEVKLPEPESEPLNNDGFFSETLAKIYVKQKKYDQALEIIHQLNLIYPEKNRYFADQIRFLEKLIIKTNKNK